MTLRHQKKRKATEGDDLGSSMKKRQAEVTLTSIDDMPKLTTMHEVPMVQKNQKGLVLKHMGSPGNAALFITNPSAEEVALAAGAVVLGFGNAKFKQKNDGKVNVATYLCAF